jgi:hypothetical protein
MRTVGCSRHRDFDIPALAWDWYGWSSDVPIGRIEIHGHSTPGKPLVFDNMELTQVPAPGVMAVLSIGLGVPQCAGACERDFAGTPWIGSCTDASSTAWTGASRLIEKEMT